MRRRAVRQVLVLRSARWILEGHRAGLAPAGRQGVRGPDQSSLDAQHRHREVRQRGVPEDRPRCQRPGRQQAAHPLSLRRDALRPDAAVRDERHRPTPRTGCRRTPTSCSSCSTPATKRLATSSSKTRWGHRLVNTVVNTGTADSPRRDRSGRRPRLPAASRSASASGCRRSSSASTSCPTDPAAHRRQPDRRLRHLGADLCPRQAEFPTGLRRRPWSSPTTRPGRLPAAATCTSRRTPTPWPVNTTATNNTLTLTLPSDGSWVPFVIAGKFGAPSTNDKDTIIEAHHVHGGRRGPRHARR